MDIKDIKVGETYNVRMKCVDDKESGLRYFAMETMPYIFRLFDKKDIETCVFPLLPPANGTKNTETAPKYDPCRLFRKGDKVRLVQCNGRNPFDSFNGIEYPPDETIYTVDGDEYDNGKVELYSMDSCDVFELHHSNLELVTPVEELEPYYVKNIIRGYAVYKRGAGDLAASCVFWSKYHPNAKEAAEAERDRLNAEHRKENNHA